MRLKDKMLTFAFNHAAFRFCLVLLLRHVKHKRTCCTSFVLDILVLVFVPFFRARLPPRLLSSSSNKVIPLARKFSSLSSAGRSKRMFSARTFPFIHAAVLNGIAQNFRVCCAGYQQNKTLYTSICYSFSFVHHQNDSDQKAAKQFG